MLAFDAVWVGSPKAAFFENVKKENNLRACSVCHDASVALTNIEGIVAQGPKRAM